LFEEWKELVNYYSDLESLKADNGSSSNTGSSNTGSSNTGSNSNTGSSGQVNNGSQPNKSPAQEQEQVDNSGSNDETIYIGNDKDMGSEGLAGETGPGWL